MAKNAFSATLIVFLVAFGGLSLATDEERAVRDAVEVDRELFESDDFYDQISGAGTLVDIGDNGLLVPARDPVALADALETLLQDAALRRRMGAAGRQRVLAHFADDVVCRQTMRIFRELIGARWPRRTARSRPVLAG